MYMLLTNQPFTRRKTLHHIVDPEGSVVWSGPNIGDAIEYLLAADQSWFCVECYPSGEQYKIEVLAWDGKRHEITIK